MILVIFLYTIENNKIDFTVNKSKFITYICYIDNKNDIDIVLDKIKCEHPGATHYVYAYILDNINHFTDDKEPSGSAGKPILNVLEKNKLDHIICVVVRYFGGIKLGCGMLTRTYSKCASDVIKNSNIVELEDGYLIRLVSDFKNINNLKKIKMNIINKTFEEKAIYTIEITKENFEKLKEMNYEIEIIKEIEVKK